MQKIAAVFCSLFISFTIYGQTSKSCTDYEEAIKRGNSFLLSKNDDEKSEKAMREFRTAKYFAKQCGISDSLAEKGINKVIDEYKKQRDNAKKAEKTAKDALKEIKKKNQENNLLIQQNDMLKNILSKGGFNTAAVREKKNISNFDTSLYDKKITYNNAGDLTLKINPTNITVINPNNITVLNSKFFLKVKNINDSLASLYNENNFTGINNQDDESAILALLDRLDKDIDQNIVAKHLLDSTKAELKNLREDNPNYDFLVYAYLRSVLYYSWNLTDLKQFGFAKKALDEAEQFIDFLKNKSAIIYSGIAGIQNAYYNYYSVQNLDRKSYAYIRLAIENGANAVEKNPYNPLYQRGLAVLVRNSSYIPDLILSKENKLALSRLGYECIYNIERYFPGKGISLNELCINATNLSDKLIEAGYFKNAIDTLDRAAEQLDKYIQVNHSDEKKYLLKIKLLTKASGISIDSLKSFSRGKKYLDSVYAAWNSIKSESLQRSDFSQFTESNNYLNNLLNIASTRSDSIKALETFNFAINSFERLNILDTFSTFSEDISKYIIPYKERLVVNISLDRSPDVTKDYTTLNEKFNKPFYLRYRFDFYLGQPLVNALKLYGNYMCRKGEYKEALPILKFASLEGVRESTDSVISIYQRPSFKNSDSVKFYQQRAGYQSPGMKRFTVPTDFGGVKYPFYVYVLDRAKEYPYTGIRDQVEWVKEARGGKVPEDVITSFDKLQKIAWDNEVSFQDLCIYALGAASKDSNDVNTLMKGKTIEELLSLLKLYAGRQDKLRVDTIVNEIIEIQKRNATDYDLKVSYYQLIAGNDNINLLLLPQREVEKYRNYFVAKGVSDLRTNSLKREHYYNLTILDSLYYLTNKNKSIRTQIAQDYNSLGWYSLLSKKWGNVEYYLEQSIRYDSTSPYPKGNLPHAYLFNNEFERAKTEYLRLKDLPFDAKAGYPTYKDAFLSDFNDFEKEGLMNDDMRKIWRLLTEK
jgi:hypothetical protein